MAGGKIAPKLSELIQCKQIINQLYMKKYRFLSKFVLAD